MSITNIYILKLQDEKYYIGKSNNVQKRFEKHLNGTESVWTVIHKPISIEKIIPNSSIYDEDKYVKEYIYKYGIENVRGGSYQNNILNDREKYLLLNEIYRNNNICIKCKRIGHLAKDCYAKTTIDGNTLEDSDDTIFECENCTTEFFNEEMCLKHEQKCFKFICKIKYSNSCFRCGAYGHTTNNCIVKIDKDGNKLDLDLSSYDSE
jgi:hypothetical protein